MDARHADMAENMRQEDIAEPMDGVEPGSEANITPPPTEPNIAQSEDEQPLPSLVKPVANATMEP